MSNKQPSCSAWNSIVIGQSWATSPPTSPSLLSPQMTASVARLSGRQLQCPSFQHVASKQQETFPAYFLGRLAYPQTIWNIRNSPLDFYCGAWAQWFDFRLPLSNRTSTLFAPSHASRDKPNRFSHSCMLIRELPMKSEGDLGACPVVCADWFERLPAPPPLHDHRFKLSSQSYGERFDSRATTWLVDLHLLLTRQPFKLWNVIQKPLFTLARSLKTHRNTYVFHCPKRHFQSLSLGFCLSCFWHVLSYQTGHTKDRTCQGKRKRPNLLKAQTGLCQLTIL